MSGPWLARCFVRAEPVLGQDVDQGIVQSATSVLCTSHGDFLVCDGDGHPLNGLRGVGRLLLRLLETETQSLTKAARRVKGGKCEVVVLRTAEVIDKMQGWREQTRSTQPAY